VVRRITGAAMASAEVEIINKLGLHARASAKLTQVASAFKCEVWLMRNGRRVNAKSIMGVMMLAAGKGASITIQAEGEDAEAALAAVLKLIADKFDEGE
jgi:phosphocarrier protein HPr